MRLRQTLVGELVWGLVEVGVGGGERAGGEGYGGG